MHTEGARSTNNISRQCTADTTSTRSVVAPVPRLNPTLALFRGLILRILLVREVFFQARHSGILPALPGTSGSCTARHSDSTGWVSAVGISYWLMLPISVVSCRFQSARCSSTDRISGFHTARYIVLLYSGYQYYSDGMFQICSEYLGVK